MTLRINPNIRSLHCSRTGNEVPTGDFSRPIGLCSCCPPPSKPVVVAYDGERVRAELATRPLTARGEPGMWRFAPLLPVVEVPPGYAEDVGGTPVVRHQALSSELSVEVFLKNEGVCPSGSFKDRGLAVGVALGRACGAQRFCLPTQGNAGVAACIASCTPAYRVKCRRGCDVSEQSGRESALRNFADGGAVNLRAPRRLGEPILRTAITVIFRGAS